MQTRLQINDHRKYWLWIIIIFGLWFWPDAVHAEDVVTPPAPNTANQTISQVAPSETLGGTNVVPAANAPQQPNPPAQGPAQTTGPVKPNGDASKTYTYNATTGQWENEFYVWDPIKHRTTPKNSLDYSYNPRTGKWDTTEWLYDVAAGKYIANVVSQDAPPAYATDTNCVSNCVGGSDLPNLDGQTNSNITNLNSNNSAEYSGFYDSRISNSIIAQSRSGNATGYGNTNIGNVGSGNADTILNLINILRSNWVGLGPQFTTFQDTITGNVVGDMFIDPSKINNINNLNQTNNLVVHNQTNGLIDNNINLNAASGNATLANNSYGGNVTTGNASAVANIINMINSMISSGQSFVGVLNIMGNLNGDILLPPDVLNSLLASNAPNSPVSTTINNNNSINLDQSATSNIDNNIKTNATSGSSNALNNTRAGNVSTGSANNNVTVLNLTGHNVVAKDALLVFVNVLGTWVGMIMNTPGATSAALGGGVTENITNANNISITDTSTNTIHNNLDISATSGNALAENNTQVGNVSTGDAYVGVNVANILGSSFSLTDWFGVLFINVFGSWEGSFGVNTAAGTIIVEDNNQTVHLPAVFYFASADARNNTKPLPHQAQNAGAGGSEIGDVDLTSTLGASLNSGSDNSLTNPLSQNNSKNMNSSGKYIAPVMGSAMVGVSTLVGDGIVTARRRRRKAESVDQ